MVQFFWFSIVYYVENYSISSIPTKKKNTNDKDNLIDKENVFILSIKNRREEYFIDKENNDKNILSIKAKICVGKPY